MTPHWKISYFPTLIIVVLFISSAVEAAEFTIHRSKSSIIGEIDGNSETSIRMIEYPIEGLTVTSIDHVADDGKIVSVPLTQQLPANAFNDEEKNSRLVAIARYFQPVPGGGYLSHIDQTTMSRSGGRTAFFGWIDGSEKTQGIFVADRSRLRPIAVACGNRNIRNQPAPKGCGTRAPVGGTFQHFFGGSGDAPSINQRGDVLFAADVQDGSRSRGLFLYMASSKEIKKIAAVGDRSPFGGEFATIGTGSLNNLGDVVFVAGTSPRALHEQQIVSWKDGVLTGIVKAGDPAPGGGEFKYVSGAAASFNDGTSRPLFAPDINDNGSISIWALVKTDANSFPPVLLVHKNGVLSTYLQYGDEAPGGGVFKMFGNPILNRNDEIAFIAEFRDTGKSELGWFAGKPGAWRRVLVTTDKIPGDGKIVSMATSMNPMSPIDDSGNVLVWARVKFPDGVRDCLVLDAPQHHHRVVLTESRTRGGAIGEINSWPSLDRNGLAAINTNGVVYLLGPIVVR